MSSDKIIVKIDADLEELIPGFLENRGRDRGSLQAALQESNFATMQSIGHSLKGVGGGYGFARMSELGAAIETAAKGQKLDELKGLIQQYGEYLDAVEVEFE